MTGEPISESKEIGGLTVETLGVLGEFLPPLIDWERLPTHVPRERIEDFSLSIINDGGTPKLLSEIMSNIRYIDRAHTQAAMQVLANYLTTLSQTEKIVLIHDEGQSGSRQWMCDELGKLGEFSIMSENEIDQSMTDVIFVLPDDLMIFGEQSTRIMERVREKVGKNTKFIEAYLAATDNTNNGFRRNDNTYQKIVRAYSVPDLSQSGITSKIPRITNNSYILTFFDHKVSDRVLPSLTRSNAESNEYHWLIDDLTVAPPYEPDRFTNLNSGWAHLARRIPRELNRPI